jgi:hypothetical protein
MPTSTLATTSIVRPLQATTPLGQIHDVSANADLKSCDVRSVVAYGIKSAVNRQRHTRCASKSRGQGMGHASRLVQTGLSTRMSCCALQRAQPLNSLSRILRADLISRLLS